MREVGEEGYAEREREEVEDEEEREKTKKTKIRTRKAIFNVLYFSKLSQ